MTPRRFMIQGGGERLLRWLLGGWLMYLSAGLALRGDSPLLVALGLAECVGAVLFMRHKTSRWGAVMLLLSFAFAAGFHLRAGERPVLLAGYAAAVAALTLASSWRFSAGGSGLSPDDQTFLREFEQSRIAPADFHHRDHIRAAWAVLGSYPLSEAISRYTAAIKRLAARRENPRSIMRRSPGRTCCSSTNGCRNRAATWRFPLLPRGIPTCWPGIRRFWRRITAKRSSTPRGRGRSSYCPEDRRQRRVHRRPDR